MNSQKSLSFLGLVMAEVPFDPVFRSFWERFPCPPSWNSDLLFRTNWTSCVSPGVGERIIIYMADKCGIKNLPSNITPVSRDEDRGDILEDTCALNCQIIVALVCVLFVVFTVIGIIIIVYRKRKCKRKSSPPHPSNTDKMFSSAVNGSRRPPPSNIPSSTSLGDQNQNPLLRRPLPPLPNNCHFANYRILHDGDNSSSCASHSTGGQSPVYEYIDDQSVHYSCQPCHVCHRHSRELGCVACVPPRQNYNRNSQDLIRFSFSHPGYNDDPGDEIWFDEQGRQYNAPWNDRQLINMFKDDPRFPRDASVPRRSQSSYRLSRDSREMVPICGCADRYSIDNNYRSDRSDTDISDRSNQILSNETQFVNHPNDASGVTIHFNPRHSQGYQDGRRRMPARGGNSHRHSKPDMPLSPSGDRLSARDGSDRRPIPVIHADYFSSEA